MVALAEILLLLLGVARFIVIAHVIISLLVNFNVLNYSQPIVRSIYDGLNRLLEPLYGPIRRALPNTGGLDLSPLIVLIGIEVARILVFRGLIGA